MRILPCSILVLGLALSPALVLAGAPPNARMIEELVAQLGSGKYAQREAAMRKLEALGEAILPALKKAATLGDLELSRRAEQLVRTIQGRAEVARLLGGKRVQLVCKDVSVLDAIRQLATKSGFDICIDGDETPLAKRKVTLETGETTFWDALARLCEAAGVADGTSMPGRGFEPPCPGGPDHDLPVILVDGRTKPLPTHLGGAVRLRALPTNARVRATLEEPAAVGAKAQTGFLLEVFPEPRLPWHGIVGVRITKATDEHGQVVSQTNAYHPPQPGSVSEEDRPGVWDGGSGRPIALLPGPTVVPVRLNVSQRASTRLKEVQGILTVRLSVVRELLTVGDVLKLAGQKVADEHGRFVRIVQVTRKDDTLELHAQIQPQATDAAGAVPFRVVRSRGGLIMRKTNEASMATLSLHDAKGAAVKPLRSERQLTPNPKGGLLIEFHQAYPVPAQKEPLWLSCSGPQVLIVDIPFTLRDVPISAAALPARRALAPNPYE